MCIPYKFRHTGAAFFASLLLSLALPAASFAAGPDASRILTLPDYWEAATPEQVRKLVAGQSISDIKTDESESGRTPLMLAAHRSPHPEIIDILVAAGCGVNAQTNYRNTFHHPSSTYEYESQTEDVCSALQFAVMNPNPAVLGALLRHKPDLNARPGAPVPFSALELAARRPGRTEHLRLLLEAGARPDVRPGEEPERYSIWKFFLGYIGEFLYRSDPLSGLNYAKGILLSPDEAAAKTELLLGSGVKPDADALARALASGHNEAARMLMDAGADPAGKIGEASMLYHALFRPNASENIGYGVIDAPGPGADILGRLIRASGNLKGETELLPRVCKSGLSAEVARALVKAGAPYSTKGNGLMFDALESNNDCADLVEYLLELGFSAMDRGSGGLSPLRAAAKYPRQKPRCASVLVKAGATLEDIEDVAEINRDFSVQAGISDEAGNIIAVAAPPPEADAKRLRAEHDSILKLARENPKEAAYWRTFYSVATPDEVRGIIGGRDLSGIKTVKEKVPAQRSPDPDMSVLALPFLIFDESFWTGKRTVTSELTPLAEAAWATPHPEVIHMLVKAGCKVTDLRSGALTHALYNPNPDVLEAVLSYKPDLETEIFYLGSALRLLAANDPAVFRREHFRLLLKAGADPNATSGNESDTPLMKAAYYRNAEAARMLLAAGAKTDITNRAGETALDIAVGSEAYDIAREILKSGGITKLKDYRNPLLALARNEHTDYDLARELVVLIGSRSEEAGSAIIAAAMRGHADTLKSLLDAGAEGKDKKAALESAMLRSVSMDGNDYPKDNPAVISILLAHGADPAAATEEHGVTALHFAALYGLPRTADILLKAGVPANIQNAEGHTPLFWAAFPGSAIDDLFSYTAPKRVNDCAAVAKLLVAAGANAFAGEGQASPLIPGLSNPEMTELLLSAGGKSRVNEILYENRTPLTFAAEHGQNADSIPLLLAAGAKPDMRDGNGRLPLDVALEKKNGRAVAYLTAVR